MEIGNTKILDKIRKLLAYEISERGIGNEKAATAFALKVRELLVKYDLELADVPLAEGRIEIKDAVVTAEAYGDIDPGKRVAWTEELARGIAKAHACRVILYEDSSAVCFVGRAHDREIAAHMFIVLARAALRVNPYTGVMKNEERYQSFLLGFATRIKARYDIMMVADSNQALIPISKRVDEYVDEHTNGTASNLAEEINGWAFAIGELKANKERLTGRGLTADNRLRISDEGRHRDG